MTDVANAGLTEQEKQSVNYILVYTRDCKYTNNMLRHVHSDIEFICYEKQIDNSIIAPFTAAVNFKNQITGEKTTKVSLDKIRQVPNYEYNSISGFKPTGKKCEGSVCLIKRDDLTGGMLKWVPPQPKNITDENVRAHFQEMVKEYNSLNADYGSARANWGMNDTSGGKRNKRTKRRTKSSKRTKRRRGTRKRSNKKR
jgi:hypothetical protein